jgi:hypothetical protein
MTKWQDDDSLRVERVVEGNGSIYLQVQARPQTCRSRSSLECYCVARIVVTIITEYDTPFSAMEATICLYLSTCETTCMRKCTLVYVPMLSLSAAASNEYGRAPTMPPLIPSLFPHPAASTRQTWFRHIHHIHQRRSQHSTQAMTHDSYIMHRVSVWYMDISISPSQYGILDVDKV